MKFSCSEDFFVTHQHPYHSSLLCSLLSYNAKVTLQNVQPTAVHVLHRCALLPHAASHKDRNFIVSWTIVVQCVCQKIKATR